MPEETSLTTVDTGTFMGLPRATSAAGTSAAILGIPFDWGVHQFRIGSRDGPNAIRTQSRLIRRYDVDVGHEDFLAELKAVDVGNVILTPSRIEEANDAIEAAVTGILSAGAAPVTMGGDGTVSLPQMRAVHKAYSDLAVIHIDSHTDCYDIPGYTTATSFMRAAEEGLVDVAASWQVGMRGTTFTGEVYDVCRRVGYQLITMDELAGAGFRETGSRIREALGTRPVYLCFDMDFFDPSVAPGVCSPSWGGATAREGLTLLRGLEGINVVAVDVNTVSPNHDVSGLTAALAAHVMYRGAYMIWLALQERG
jgi:agmatinase